jgi:hypothetical protein
VLWVNRVNEAVTMVTEAWPKHGDPMFFDTSSIPGTGGINSKKNPAKLQQKVLELPTEDMPHYKETEYSACRRLRGDLIQTYNFSKY